MSLARCECCGGFTEVDDSKLTIATARVRQLEEDNTRLVTSLNEASKLALEMEKKQAERITQLEWALKNHERVQEVCNQLFRDASKLVEHLWPEPERPVGIQMICHKLRDTAIERDSLQSQRDELVRVVEMAEEWLTKIAADNADQDGDGVKLTMFKAANRHATSVALHFIRQASERLGLPSSHARAALGKGAVDSAPQSAHTPNKEKT